jgi:glycogen debranching enzyme
MTSFESLPKTIHMNFENAFKAAEAEMRRKRSTACVVQTGNHRFTDWMNRSFVDLQMMTTDTESGLYPYAGVPWFSTVFGRDGLITAMETLWMQPAIAKGVLSYLAANQATETNYDQDAEPGKILHEMRKGEMAATKEIPFGKYYGSVDSTPLFIMLAGMYYRRTGDREFIERIWPNIELALQWINEYGDCDGDGFVEYSRKSADGVIQQC